MIFEHEQVQLRTGRRSGATIIVAIHSTKEGPALGGCRIAPYPDVTAALADALRLSQAMTLKSSVAQLGMGGGKTVVALAPGHTTPRQAILHDIGDIIESLDGAYITGPDVGTGPQDMAVIGERTRHVLCRPESLGGSGDSSLHTALGVLAAIKSVCNDPTRFTVIGLGHVGTHLARILAAQGKTLILSDTDPARKAIARELDTQWVTPQTALETECDVLIPAATGGMITVELVPRLRCKAIIGPANNQLASNDVADRLRQHGIIWIPDHIASAGGIIHAVAAELYRETPGQITTRINGIGDTALSYMDSQPPVQPPGRCGCPAAYDAVARAYDEQLGSELDGKPLDRALLEGFIELAGTGTIADVGCGPGHLTRFLAAGHSAARPATESALARATATRLILQPRN